MPRKKYVEWAQCYIPFHGKKMHKQIKDRNK